MLNNSTNSTTPLTRQDVFNYADDGTYLGGYKPGFVLKVGMIFADELVHRADLSARTTKYNWQVTFVSENGGYQVRRILKNGKLGAVDGGLWSNDGVGYEPGGVSAWGN